MEQAQLVANLIITAVGVSVTVHGILVSYFLTRRAAEAL